MEDASMDYNWADCSMCEEKDKRIEELERQKELLEGALEFEKERANGLAEEVEQHELKALGDEFDMMHEMVHSRYVAERIYAILEEGLLNEIQWKSADKDNRTKNS